MPIQPSHAGAGASAGVVSVLLAAAVAGCAGGPTRTPALDLLEAICTVEVEPFPEEYVQDAQAYADASGVSLEEAKRRLSLQNVTGVYEAGRAAAPDKWAGGFLDHEPTFGYVLFYKGRESEVDYVRAAVEECTVPIIVRSGARYTEHELLDGMERIQQSGRLDHDVPLLGMGPDLEEQAIVLNGPIDPGADVLAELARIAEVPVVFVEAGAVVPQ